MVYIKKLIAHGFKSFAKKTEIVFDRGSNVVLGANGSGKSNVADALCFVLGRLSIKSMRAAKARNLLFMGSKYAKPAREAVVELFLDNTDRAFAIDSDEVVIRRSVRYNGQSVYKINDETKTRMEIIETLAQASIDPYGFNLVLQGQIQSIVKMHPEDRRKIIEEVAGISIYESRKAKSLQELEKTEERLKEIGSTLRERTAYLKNLDRERSQALRYKELDSMARRIKASLLKRKSRDKEKEIAVLLESINEKKEQRDELKQKVSELQEQIESLNQRINMITRNIQQATGIEQDTLHTALANLRAEIEGLKVRKENHENRKAELGRRVQELENNIPAIEQEIRILREELPGSQQKTQELQKKKEELAGLEEQRRQLVQAKAGLQGVQERTSERQRNLARLDASVEEIMRQLEEGARKCRHKSEEACKKALAREREKLENLHKELEEKRNEVSGYETELSISESEKAKAEKLIEQVAKLDTCPLCQCKITEEHIAHVKKNQEEIIANSIEKHKNITAIRKKLLNLQNSLKIEMRDGELALKSFENEIPIHFSLHEKQERIKSISREQEVLRKEIHLLEEKRRSLESELTKLPFIEEKYDRAFNEFEEISARTSKTADTSLLFKERDIESIKAALKRSRKDLAELEDIRKQIIANLEERVAQLSGKEAQEKELKKRFKQLFEERESIQQQIQESAFSISELETKAGSLDEQANYLLIGKAKLDAEKEATDMELREYDGLELIQGSMNALEERLHKTQQALQEIGSTNMRALEVYDEVKKEYDLVYGKVEILEKEKADIAGIISEIDAKKRRSFMKTFRALNELFTRNFSELYSKGAAYLALENEEDLFAGGVSIVVRLAKGKHFDVTSLSGGEQALIALSLLFAIQEFKPYHFYIFDEIDAALDKRNSERLVVLLNKHMTSGQYIIISHNDAIILNSNIIYGVSMHEGVSKVLSLNLEESLQQAAAIQAQAEEEAKKLEQAQPALDASPEITSQDFIKSEDSPI